MILPPVCFCLDHALLDLRHQPCGDQIDTIASFVDEDAVTNDRRFDALVRRCRSRCAALASLVAFDAALRVGSAAAACSANEVKCDPNGPETPCTGICKKRRGNFNCAPAGPAQGCMKDLDPVCSAMAMIL